MASKHELDPCKRANELSKRIMQDWAVFEEANPNMPPQRWHEEYAERVTRKLHLLEARRVAAHHPWYCSAMSSEQRWRNYQSKLKAGLIRRRK